MSLSRLLEELAEARLIAKFASGVLQAARDQFTIENASTIERVETASANVGRLESAVRETALERYAVDGNKKPTPGVAIRVLTKLNYDPAAALAWAKEHTIALALDKRAFSKIANVDPPAFVEVTEEPQATIARTLKEDHASSNTHQQ